MISIKDLKTSEGPSLPKVIGPGNVTCKIHKVWLEKPSYDQNAYFLVMNVETEPIENFEGFFINKDNPDEGRYLGQVGRVKANEYAFKDGVTKTGVNVSRDMDILKAIQNIARNTNCLNWMEDNDGKFETIEEYVEAFNESAPFKDQFIKTCIGGKEYTNKDGYTNYDLFLVRNQRTAYNMGPVNDNGKVMTFDETLHVKKKKVENVESFGSDDVTTSSSVSSDFDL